ncbi:MAG: hypothetical protein LBD45_02705 [Bacteroidales bacterium]|jgi:hypothetical protein|nr:hypothetical protein [Bacteroidales bacterium]
MKKIFLVFAATFLIMATASSQTPDSFQYQALIAGNDGSALAQASVKVRFNIREGSTAGTVVYSEIHNSVPTNAVGMVSLQIGKGISESEKTFANINWAKGPYFLETEVNKGSGYLPTGIQQFLSVPYAKYADNAGKVIMTSSGGKKWSVTIDDAGNLSAQEITE